MGVLYASKCTCECNVQRPEEDGGSPETGVMDTGYTMWIPRTKPRSSDKSAASALKLRVTSPIPTTKS